MIQALADKLKDQPIDVLLNNAAILGEPADQMFGDFDYDLMNLVMAVNVEGPLRLSEAFVEHGTEPANIADGRGIVAIFHRLDTFDHTGPQPGAALIQILLIDHIQDGVGRHTADGTAAIGAAETTWVQRIHESHPSHFIRFLKQTYVDYEIGRKEDNWASNSYEVWGLIVNRDGRIWDIDSHLALSTIPSGHLWARGSGMEYALGADYALTRQNADARTRVEQAVAAAIHYDINCPGSVQVKKFPAAAETQLA